MDPNHRDRIAFARLCSGKLRRGMKAKLTRTAKPMTLSTPQFFFAQDRALAEEAYAGDVVGIPNHGTLRIGDTLTEGEDIAFLGVPNFAPEILRRVSLWFYPMKAKKLKEALQQMAEEGVVQVLPHSTERRRSWEWSVPCSSTCSRCGCLKSMASRSLSSSPSSSWLAGSPRPTGKRSRILCRPTIRAAPKIYGDKVFMARNQFILDYTRERALGISFTDIKDVKDTTA